MNSTTSNAYLPHYLESTTSPLNLSNGTYVTADEADITTSDVLIKWIVITFLTGMCISGTFFNVVIIKRLWRKSVEQTNALVLNLAAADVIICLTTIPYKILQMTNAPIRSFMCFSIIPLDFLTTIVSVYTVLALSLEHYLAISKSQVHARYGTTRNVVLVVVAVWVYALIASLAGIPYIQFDGQDCRITSQAYILAAIYVNVMLPVIVISGLHLHLWCMQSATVTLYTHFPAPRDAMTARLIFTVLTVCWLPLSVIGTVLWARIDWAWQLFTEYPVVYTVISSVFFKILPSMSSVLNPVVMRMRLNAQKTVFFV